MHENIKTGHSAILEGSRMAICEGAYTSTVNDMSGSETELKP